MGSLSNSGTQLPTQASYIKPRTVNEATILLASGKPRILSGGTDFYPSLREHVIRDAIVDISGLRDLRSVSFEADRIRIGGLTTWTDIIRAPLPRCFDALKSAAREVGSVQIQNRGTVAGNLCNASPAADGVPPLLALDAEVELTSQAGIEKCRWLISSSAIGRRGAGRTNC